MSVINTHTHFVVQNVKGEKMVSSFLTFAFAHAFHRDLCQRDALLLTREAFIEYACYNGVDTTDLPPEQGTEAYEQWKVRRRTAA